MSSFICNPEHFNSIERALKSLGNDTSFYLTPKFSKLLKSFHPQDDYEAITIFMDTLRELSVLCVSLQYKHHYVGFLDKEIEDQKAILFSDKHSSITLDHVGLLKAIQCVGYQIELEHLQELREITEAEQNAIGLIEGYEQTLSMYIINKLPSYEASAWCIGK